MISKRSVPKSPTSVAVVPTFELVPFVLIRTWSRSGRVGELTVRVQKVKRLPFCNVTGAVISQLLIVPQPVSELTETYEFAAPA